MKKLSSLSSFTKKQTPKLFMQQLWRWSVEPSPKITEPDRRRQARLLSVFLISIILLAAVVELLTIAVTESDNYTGYRPTLVIVIALAFIYRISRTEHVQLAALLMIIVMLAGIYYIGLTQPSSVQGGLFDFMILPLWLSSLYLSLGGIVSIMLGSLILMLLFPILAPQVTLSEILVGPFSFIFTTSILLIILTRHRNGLERDRQTELAEKEQHSRRDTARAEALLRVAERLNAQLDLDTLLDTISEEIVLTFNTPVSMVMLFDKRENVLRVAAGQGLSSDLVHGLLSFSKAAYDQTVDALGSVFAVTDLQSTSSATYLNEFKRLNLRSIAFATMHYDHELVGSLNAITVGEKRNFTEDELLLLHGLADQAALAIINTRLYKDAHRRLDRLQALRAIDIAITTNHDLQETLNVLLTQITKQLHVDAAVILLLDETKGLLEFGASLGFQTSTLRYTSLRIGQGMAGRAAEQRQIVYIHDLRTDPQSLVNAPSLAKEGFVSYHAAPLITQGKVKGVLEVFHRSPLNPDKEWGDFLEALAGQAAIAIESTTLFEDLQRTNDELSQAYDSTIEGWSHALDLRDKETEGHTQRVTEMTLKLAAAFGLSETELVHVRRGSLLHDIGKMGIPDRILFKEGQLTDAEWMIMRQHPVYAHDMLRSVDYLRPALDIPYCHHEKWDGTGYPRGLKGEEIPLIARIFAVIDVWDAVTSDRPYRRAWSRADALAHIQKGAGQHFDTHVVEVFSKLISQNLIEK